ncbi:aspartokinase [Anopheles sinensis]|uniref:Aspartokinase n=1 Tax=Anopheles sinensis TaxID=74873 RepID=A0A084WHL4_ANOSI|nr:aspartokinase [Anopheles sinensis]
MGVDATHTSYVKSCLPLLSPSTLPTQQNPYTHSTTQARTFFTPSSSRKPVNHTVEVNFMLHPSRIGTLEHMPDVTSARTDMSSAVTYGPRYGEGKCTSPMGKRGGKEGMDDKNVLRRPGGHTRKRKGQEIERHMFIDGEKMENQLEEFPSPMPAWWQMGKSKFDRFGN